MNAAVVRSCSVLVVVFSTVACAGNDPQLTESEATATEAAVSRPAALRGLRPEPVAGMMVANGNTTIWYQGGSWKTFQGSPADNVANEHLLASGRYQVPPGYSYSDLVGFWHRDASSGAEYFRDGTVATVSHGDVGTPERVRKWPRNESADKLVAIAASDKAVLSWYSDDELASGTTTDLQANYLGVFNVATGQSSNTVDAVAVDAGDGTIWALYQDGSVSHGSSQTFDRYGVWKPPAPVATPCPTDGDGAIVAPAGCVVFTPAQAGAAPDGVNATSNNYALEPGGTARGLLVVHLNGSLGSPTGQVVSPETNVYSVLAGAGYHVLGLSYQSELVLGQECHNSTCYAASREAIVRGKPVSGAASLLQSIQQDEGILARLDAALAVLAEERPNGGWKNFRSAGSSADARVKWSSVIASGHSQGGGHAAYMGKLFGLRGVLQLSSTCDSVAGVPAQWTSTGPWATAPAAKFIGFAAAADPICPDHAAVWAAMGVAPERRHNNAVTHDDDVNCVGGSHGATIACSSNLLALPAMLSADLGLSAQNR